MKPLFIVNDPPSDTERVYGALRLANALAKRPPAEVTVFHVADAVLAAKAGQKMPEGFYNIERMLKRLLAAEGQVLLCGTCMDARGSGEGEILDGARRSTMDELATCTVEADKVVAF